MKKNILNVLLVFLALTLAISCEAETPTKDEPAPAGTGKVTIIANQEKSLDSKVNRDIKYWEFMATPKFELAKGEKLYGQVSFWKTLPDLDTIDGVVKTATSLGLYTSGEWYFELRALNDKNRVLYVGSTTQVIRAGVDNTVNITMLTDRADGTHGDSSDGTSQYTGKNNVSDVGALTISPEGTLHIGFVINKLDMDPANLDIEIYSRSVGKDSVIAAPKKLSGLSWERRDAGEPYTNWYINANERNYEDIDGNNEKVVEEGKTYYECVISNIKAGPYIYNIQFLGKNISGSLIPIAGQMIEVNIVGNEEAQIKGTLLPNEYIKTGFGIDELGTIYGSINGRKYLKVSEGENAILKFEQTTEEQSKSKETPSEFYWMINGEVIVGENENTLTLGCPKNEKGQPAYGIHRVSIIPVGEQGSLGCATIDVIFNPPEGPGDWGDVDWPEGMIPTEPGDETAGA